MARSTDWRGGRWLGLLARTALVCAVFLVAGAWPAQAGINTWTSHGPVEGGFHALAIDPIRPSRIYAGTDGGGAVALAVRLRGGDAWSRLSSYGSHCHAGECRERA